jgi:GT2 family glycosyltransferase
MPVCEDYDLWLRILKEGKIDLVPQKLIYKYGGADDQLSLKYKFLDRWHVKSLFKHVDQEEVPAKLLQMIGGLEKVGYKYSDEELLDECAVWKLRLENESIVS